MKNSLQVEIENIVSMGAVLLSKWMATTYTTLRSFKATLFVLLNFIPSYNAWSPSYIIKGVESTEGKGTPILGVLVRG